MIGMVPLVTAGSATPTTNAWYEQANGWITDQGGWIAALGAIVVIGPALYRWLPRAFAPIPLTRRKRAWELLERVGNANSSGPAGMTRAAQSFVVREEAYDAVSRKLKWFLILILIVYPLVAVFVFFLAADLKAVKTGGQLELLGGLLLVATVLGIFSSAYDARCNRRILEVIDSLVAQEENHQMLLVNPSKAITEECKRIGQRNLMQDKIAVVLGRKWQQMNRRRRARKKMKALIKANLILRASRTAWQQAHG